MKKTVIAAAVLTVPLLAADATLAKSKGDCQKQATKYADNNTHTLGQAAVGGVIGGVAGAVVGGALGGSSGAKSGAIIGGAGGAVTGTLRGSKEWQENYDKAYDDCMS